MKIGQAGALIGDSWYVWEECCEGEVLVRPNS